ncbi:MAG: hypothetical protein A3J24_09900 [Deltaproteobacteria bacterium RIFCSPLOWO2_02_FULL_53_8]|nr:MAG: hypothetical protein A3J24_09900 [Deltaproteobacteria bacterium RIFCSPLOWO2_02_FULL_53_8]
MTLDSSSNLGKPETSSAAGLWGQFPIRDDIQDSESANGYVLRMAVANFLNGIPAAKKMLGKTRFAVFDASDADRVASWFGADPVRLAVAFGTTGIGRNSEEMQFRGHDLSRSYFINRLHPRICIRCLEENSRCHADWELSLVTACTHHGNTLVDKCPYCLGDLSWNRPAVNTCQCGNILVELGEPDAPSTLEREFSRWCATKVCTPGSSIEMDLVACPSADDLPLIRLVQPLSLQGGLSLVYALGTADRCSQGDFTVTHRKKSSIGAAQEVLRRGSALLAQVQEGNAVDFKTSSLSVVMKLLAESAAASNQSADKSLAYSLVNKMLRYGGRSTWKSRYPQLSQMDLFP